MPNATPVDPADDATSFPIERAVPSDYRAYLAEKSRPPSKGGNTRAWHRHVLTIDGQRYSFLALGARKWAYAGDAVSFTWSWDPSRQFRNIDADSVVVEDKAGKRVVRGERGSKKWRTADTRLPARRREWKD